MKLKIKVKVFPGCETIEITDNGDCIDLRAAKDIKLEAPYANALHKSKQERRRYVEFDRAIIPLGIAMELPKGMVADIKPRSSINLAQDKYGNKSNYQMLMNNSPGFIDQTYCGPDDQWRMSIMAVGNVDIKKGDRICQFEIRPSMRATAKQKLKWLFSNGIKLVFVDELDGPDRGGFGSTGTN